MYVCMYVCMLYVCIYIYIYICLSLSLVCVTVYTKCHHKHGAKSLTPVLDLEKIFLLQKDKIYRAINIFVTKIFFYHKQGAKSLTKVLDLEPKNAEALASLQAEIRIKSAGWMVFFLFFVSPGSIRALTFQKFLFFCRWRK